jgi:ABC-type dipeptide/oligopeptide/nickel transport system permease subunit
VGESRARRRFTQNRAAVLGAILVALLALFALLGPLLSSHGPLTSEFVTGLGADEHPVGPNSSFWFGADILFRDQFVRLAYGARLSLLIAIAATLIATVIGASVGILAGYTEGTDGVVVPWSSLLALIASLFLWTSGRSGWALLGLASAVGVFFALGRLQGSQSLGLLRAGFRLNLDTALMRVVDVGLAFPFLLLVMAIGAALERTTPGSIMVTLGLTGWLGTARIIRSKALVLRNLDFVVASRALGQSTTRILLRHIAPNVVGPLIVIATISVAQMIVAESVLSFLGVGISPPAPTWGQMLYQGQTFYLVVPWTLVAPAVAILLAVLGFNLLGEGLRDALDPQDE